jgi:glutaredoxin
MFILYVLENCDYCNQAINFLEKKNIKYTTIKINNDINTKNKYKLQNNMNTFPQIFLRLSDDQFHKIGGFNDLQEFFL